VAPRFRKGYNNQTSGPVSNGTGNPQAPSLPPPQNELSLRPPPNSMIKMFPHPPKVQNLFQNQTYVEHGKVSPPKLVPPKNVISAKEVILAKTTKNTMEKLKTNMEKVLSNSFLEICVRRFGYKL